MSELKNIKNQLMNLLPKEIVITHIDIISKAKVKQLVLIINDKHLVNCFFKQTNLGDLKFTHFKSFTTFNQENILKANDFKYGLTVDRTNKTILNEIIKLHIRKEFIEELELLIDNFNTNNDKFLLNLEVEKYQLVNLTLSGVVRILVLNTLANREIKLNISNGGFDVGSLKSIKELMRYEN